MMNCHPSAVSCTFSCTMKYLVRDCDPNTGEPDDDGYDDEYVVRTVDASKRESVTEVKALKTVVFFLSSLLCFSWRIWR